MTRVIMRAENAVKHLRIEVHLLVHMKEFMPVSSSMNAIIVKKDF